MKEVEYGRGLGEGGGVWEGGVRGWWSERGGGVKGVE